MHAHLDDGYGGNFGRIWLAYGITSVRIPSINPYAGLEQREAFDAGRRPGPRVFIAGDPFDGVRVYYPGGVSVTSESSSIRSSIARRSWASIFSRPTCGCRIGCRSASSTTRTRRAGR